MIQAQKWTFRAIEQKRRPRHEYYDYLIFDKEAINYTGEKISSSTNSAGKTGWPHAEQ